MYFFQFAASAKAFPISRGLWYIRGMEDWNLRNYFQKQHKWEKYVRKLDVAKKEQNRT